MTGTLTSAYHDPATGFTVVIALNNSSAGASFAQNLAFQLAALAGANVEWTAEDQAAALSEKAICPLPAEEAAE
jgi:D-alanyl-D-alanine carboxypeptidase